MNIIDNHVDCLLVTKHLIKVFEERKEEIHHQILEYESVGQLAVDFIDSQRKLAERAISEAMLLVQEAQPPPPNGGKASHSTRHIDLYEFFTMCELFYDTTPEVKDDVLYFEKLFLPAGSYELLPDDNLVTAGHSDGESMTTATATTK